MVKHDTGVATLLYQLYLLHFGIQTTID